MHPPKYVHGLSFHTFTLRSRSFGGGLQCVLGYFGAPGVTREAQGNTAVCYARAMARPRYLVVVIVLAAACAFLAAADEEQHADSIGSTEAPSASAETSTVEDIEPLVAEAVSQAFKMGLPVFTQFGSDPNVTSECSAALVKTMLGLRRMEPWAIRIEGNKRRIENVGHPVGRYFGATPVPTAIQHHPAFVATLVNMQVPTSLSRVAVSEGESGRAIAAHC
ncbi:hypothetical protein MRX96_025943 [Rhipicephalus microplus]